MDDKIMDLLQAPFEANEIEWRVGSTTADKEKGLALAYVTNRAMQNRLDNTFGCFGWRNEFKEWKSSSQICGISVWNEDRKEWITKWDGSDDSATEAVKGGLSDSMKRCGYQWGIGRYLYKLPQIWVKLKNKKYLAETPKLPAWALPKGTKEPTIIETPTELPVKSPNKLHTTPAEELKPVISAIISLPQQKRLYAISKGQNDLAKTVLAKYKYTSSKDVENKNYKAICDEIEKLVGDK